MKEIKSDCRYFDGSKPCRFKLLCPACSHYAPAGKRILIIKFASSGDVLRTTPILPALKEKYPKSFITWVAKEPAQELLEGNPCIDRVMAFNLSSVLCLQAEKYDLLISLDKAPEAAALASMVKADKKRGYGLNSYGRVFPFNKEAEYSFLLGLDDELKFRKNAKTYQQLIYEMSNLAYSGQRYELIINSRDVSFADSFFKHNNLKKGNLVIGINTGAGKIFVNKNLSPDRIIELAEFLNNKLGARILLLGGPLEEEINKYILSRAKCKIIDGGCHNSLKEFAALINNCMLVITADTLVLHIAVALRKPVVALFGPTCPQEIDLYHRGRKVVTKAACAPCYKSVCVKKITCMDKISLEEILKAARGAIDSLKKQNKISRH